LAQASSAQMQHLHPAMARIARFLLVAALFVGADAGAHAGAANVKGQAGMSPITRVVELLKGMQTRMEEDGKAEEDSYETFVCWAKSIISQKTASNTAAQSRADTLETYISDLSNGRIELTSERVDLEKEIETLTGDIEIAGQMRQKGAADFAMAKDEMDAAIAALDKAILVLSTATQGHEQGVLMSFKGSLAATVQVRTREAASLQQAVELGQKVLTRGDALFLQRLLSGDVPERANWKKLNRKATFKMDYKARSFKIQGVLAKLLETFSGNLADASEKERGEITLYNTLMNSKGAEKTAAQGALSRMTEETGARALSLTEATDERNGLLGQISADVGYISQVTTTLANKKADWKVRIALRAKEIAAFSQAISILHSDDARDLMKKSFASQGFFFLQEGMTQKQRSAVQVLRLAAEQSKDTRLASIAKMATTPVAGQPSQFAQVITAIDSMLGVLRSEETTDITNKQTCETDRATDTREAVVKSREMDDLSDQLTSLSGKVAELNAEIKEKEARVVAINKELEETRLERAAENKVYLASKKDDEDAMVLVMNAKTVLHTFYTSNGLMLVQGKGAHGQGKQSPFQSVAGEAPPPPPSTWEAPYGGKTEESTGIIAILEMIHADIQADINKATREEQAAVTLYGSTKTNLEGERLELTNAIGAMNLAIGGHQTDITNAKTGLGTKKGELATVMGRISDAAPNCDFIAINFQVRSQNRQLEIDGLEKAKAILSGATFDGLPDPNREIKPHDAALVQNAKHKNLRAQL